jgi:hypothetical protein
MDFALINPVHERNLAGLSIIRFFVDGLNRA